MATIMLYFVMTWYIIFIVICFILTPSSNRENNEQEQEYLCYSYKNGKITCVGYYTHDEAVEHGYMMTSENF